MFFFVSNYIKISVDTLYDYPLRCFEIFHGISIKDEISRSNQHHRVSFLEINGTRYLRVVLAPLDGHENLILVHFKDPQGGRRVKKNAKKEGISDTRTLRTIRSNDGMVRPSQRNDGHTHATYVLVDRYGYNKKIAFVVFMGKLRCVIFARRFRRRESLRGILFCFM